MYSPSIFPRNNLHHLDDLIMVEQNSKETEETKKAPQVHASHSVGKAKWNGKKRNLNFALFASPSVVECIFSW